MWNSEGSVTGCLAVSLPQVCKQMYTRRCMRPFVHHVPTGVASTPWAAVIAPQDLAPASWRAHSLGGPVDQHARLDLREWQSVGASCT